MCCLLDSGGDPEMPDAGGWELAGVQVGDVLHDLIKGIDVVSFHSERGLAGVKLHLRRERRAGVCLRVDRHGLGFTVVFLFFGFSNFFLSPP